MGSSLGQLHERAVPEAWAGQGPPEWLCVPGAKRSSDKVRTFQLGEIRLQG